MSKAGKKLIAAMQEAIEVTKCGHQYVRGDTEGGRKVLRCMFCKCIVHFADGQSTTKEG